MIGSTGSARVQAGGQLVVPFDSDRGVPMTWARHASSPLTWLDFADATDPTAKGTAPADGSGLFIATATGDYGVDTEGVYVEVIPAGFQVRYDPATAPEGLAVVAVPEVWGGVQPLRWRPSSIPAGMSMDPATGIVTGPMPVGGGEVRGIAVDATGAATAASLTLRAISSDTFDVQLLRVRQRSSGDDEAEFVAGELVEEQLQTPGATPPLTAALTVAPAWLRVEDGATVKLRGTAAAGASGLATVDVTDSTGATGRWSAWIVVGDALPHQLILPERIEGEAGAAWPGELYARILGGTNPQTLAVERGTAAVDSDTRQITGTFPDMPGVRESVQFSATDADGAKVFATMESEAQPEAFAIVQSAVTVAAGATIDFTPEVSLGNEVANWAKEAGPDYIAVDRQTGACIGTAPNTADVNVLSLYAESTLGEVARLDVAVHVTLGAVGCTVPAIAAVRGAAGSVQVVATNAPGGATFERVSGPDWATVTTDGLATWGALTDSDTDVTPLVVRVTRTADSTTSTCSVVPTIADPPGLACTVTGPDNAFKGSDIDYTVTVNRGDVADATLVATVPTTGGGSRSLTVTNRGGGVWRVANDEDAGTVVTAVVTHTEGGDTTTCTATTTSRDVLECTAPSPATVLGQAVSGNAHATGGVGAHTFAASGLPTGASMSSSGALTVAATTAEGAHAYTVTVTDAANNITTCSGTIHVLSTIVCPPTPDWSGRPGATVEGTLPAIPGGGRYEKATGPSWVTIFTDGSWSATLPASPTAVSWSYTFRSAFFPRISTRCTGRVGEIIVAYPPLSCRAENNTGFQFEAITTQLFATGGDGGPYTFSTDTAGFTISGTTLRLEPKTADGTYQASITVRDAGGRTAICTSTITVSGARLDIVGAEEFGGTVHGRNAQGGRVAGASSMSLYRTTGAAEVDVDDPVTFVATIRHRGGRAPRSLALEPLNENTPVPSTLSLSGNVLTVSGLFNSDPAGGTRFAGSARLRLTDADGVSTTATVGGVPNRSISPGVAGGVWPETVVPGQVLSGALEQSLLAVQQPPGTADDTFLRRAILSANLRYGASKEVELSSTLAAYSTLAPRAWTVTVPSFAELLRIAALNRFSAFDIYELSISFWPDADGFGRGRRLTVRGGSNPIYVEPFHVVIPVLV